MFEAYPDQRSRPWSRWRIIAPFVAIAVVGLMIYMEHNTSPSTKMNSGEMRGLSFLQPLIAASGFEIGIWTRHTNTAQNDSVAKPANSNDSGVLSPPSTSAANAAIEKAEAAEAEVSRLRAELEQMNHQFEQQRADLARAEAALASRQQQKQGSKDSETDDAGEEVENVPPRVHDSEPQESEEDAPTAVEDALPRTKDALPSTEDASLKASKDVSAAIPDSLYRQPPAVEDNQAPSTAEAASETMGQAIANEARPVAGDDVKVTAPSSFLPHKSLPSTEPSLAIPVATAGVQAPDAVFALAPASDAMVTLAPTVTAELQAISTTTQVVTEPPRQSAVVTDEKKQGTSITVQSQGQSITISIGDSGTKKEPQKESVAGAATVAQQAVPSSLAGATQLSETAGAPDAAAPVEMISAAQPTTSAVKTDTAAMQTSVLSSTTPLATETFRPSRSTVFAEEVQASLPIAVASTASPAAAVSAAQVQTPERQPEATNDVSPTTSLVPTEAPMPKTPAAKAEDVKGTSITVMSQGQSITISIGDSGAKKDEGSAVPAVTAAPVTPTLPDAAPVATTTQLDAEPFAQGVFTLAPSTTSPTTLPVAAVQAEVAAGAVPLADVMASAWTPTTSSTRTTQSTTESTSPAPKDEYANLAMFGR